jgi:hypothetical protein
MRNKDTYSCVALFAGARKLEVPSDLLPRTGWERKPGWMDELGRVELMALCIPVRYRVQLGRLPEDGIRFRLELCMVVKLWGQ